jgi:hypothetical protein
MVSRAPGISLLALVLVIPGIAVAQAPQPSVQERVAVLKNGAGGVLQKVLVDASPPPPTKPGLRGRIIANKTAELTDYMKSAVSLVKSYVPPDPRPS